MGILEVFVLGAPVVPFYPFSFWVPLLKPNSRKKGTLTIKGPLRICFWVLVGFSVFESWGSGFRVLG